MLINISPGSAVAPPVKDYDFLAFVHLQHRQRLRHVRNRCGPTSQQTFRSKSAASCKDVKEGKGTVGRLFSDEALYNNLNATMRETRRSDAAIQVRQWFGGTVSINDPALYNNANDLAVQCGQWQTIYAPDKALPENC